MHSGILQMFEALRVETGGDLASAIAEFTGQPGPLGRCSCCCFCCSGLLRSSSLIPALCSKRTYWNAGGQQPRKIKCLGWCVGGMLATVAAAWAALKYPTADVRSITFGAQKVGNAAFAQVFRCATKPSAQKATLNSTPGQHAIDWVLQSFCKTSLNLGMAACHCSVRIWDAQQRDCFSLANCCQRRWLIGLSYRVVYHHDPVPSFKRRGRLPGTDSLMHVHGEIYIAAAMLSVSAQPAEHLFEWEDHDWHKYSGVCTLLRCWGSTQHASGLPRQH